MRRLIDWLDCRVLGCCPWRWDGPGSWAATCPVCKRRFGM